MRYFFVFVILLLLGCEYHERDNPDDPGAGKHYNPEPPYKPESSSSTPSSSSNVLPSSSSSSIEISSSSTPSSSSNILPSSSSSSIEISSSSIPSSSSSSESADNYIKWDGCNVSELDYRNQLIFEKGKTIVEFACDSWKNDYYIGCQGNRFNFTVEIEGHKEGDTENDIRPNGGDNGYNFPNLQPTQDGNLYRYPVPVTIITNEYELKCGIW
ncbi:MAG: hypothetical protein FWF63_04520 [Fibromonadales bacterium]|nr:hypothetical protein [Fibromonadales bacterium]